jgi:hypothetical protein
MGASAAKVLCSLRLIDSGFLRRFLGRFSLTFRKTRNRRALSAQATGIQAEFKRNSSGTDIPSQQREAAFRKSRAC